MTRLVLPLALAAVALLAGCGGSPAATSTPTGTPSSTTSTPSASPDATPTPAAVAGFELGGEAVYAVDADGDTITEYGFDDPAALIAALTAFHGAPEVVPSGTYCDAEFSAWPDEMTGALLVVVYDSGAVGIAVKAPGYLSPTAGPDFGQNASSFMASLPAGQVSESGYVYDPTTAPDLGAAAFVDGAGIVTGLASPSPPYGTGFC